MQNSELSFGAMPVYYFILLSVRAIYSLLSTDKIAMPILLLQDTHLIPIILSGGSGTRLWPLSRKMYPKQFLSFIHEETMLQKTLLRLDGLKRQSPVIVCNEEHRFLVAEQVRQIGIEDPTIILEPFGKNTAPAILQ